MDNVLKRISSYGMQRSDWIQVMQAMFQLRQVVKVGIHFYGPENVGNFLTTCATVISCKHFS